MTKRDQLTDNWKHVNVIRAIHGRKPCDLCPKCSRPTTLHRDVGEVGGASVRECAACGWNDFDELQQAYFERVHTHDPEESLYSEEF